MSPRRRHTTTTGTGWYDTTAFDALGPAGSIASTFLTFPGAGVYLNRHHHRNEDCDDIGLVEGVTCNTIAGARFEHRFSAYVFRWVRRTLRQQAPPQIPELAAVCRTLPILRTSPTTSPYTSYYKQYNGRLDADVTKADHLAFAIYWVPQGNTSYNGGSRAYNLFHHAPDQRRIFCDLEPHLSPELPQRSARQCCRMALE